jgi:sugar-specific transcriptional regulator TrmB
MIEMNKVHEALLEIVSKATFTPEALRQMQDALGKVKILESALDQTNKINGELRVELDNIKRACNAHENRAGAVAEREAIVAKRESAITEMEKKVAVAEAKESVRKEVFDTIFRNVQTRRNVVETIPVSTVSNGYSSVMAYQKGEQITEEQG